MVWANSERQQQEDTPLSKGFRPFRLSFTQSPPIRRAAFVVCSFFTTSTFGQRKEKKALQGPVSIPFKKGDGPSWEPWPLDQTLWAFSFMSHDDEGKGGKSRAQVPRAQKWAITLLSFLPTPLLITFAHVHFPNLHPLRWFFVFFPASIQSIFFAPDSLLLHMHMYSCFSCFEDPKN